MTVTINKKEFLSSSQIKQLSQAGYVIGSHTWNHPNLQYQQQTQWHRQMESPKKELEAIIGKPVDCFAYPYGAWNENVLVELSKEGFVTAFQLTNKGSKSNPLLTIRRIMVNGNWLPSTLLKKMKTTFP